jgi:RimJ/RimL family protein N-acetyltransferase
VQVLRDATDADIEAIRAWRNHPLVRQVSLGTGEIGADEHRNWWASVSANPTRRVLIFSYHDRPCGVVNFADVAPGGDGEWGFFLDTDGLEARGELLAAWMELEKAALAAMGGWTLAWNTQVLALHRRFGFVEVPQRRKIIDIDGTEQEVAWTELSRERYLARTSRRSA